ncbi:MAG: oligosaccharide flippase family protein [Bacteroidales bacterium]|nr:oligosaccharide flippase family protein [Bacteroidales bacterium]
MGVVIRQSIKGTLVTYIGAGIGILINFIIVPKYIGEELLGLTNILLSAGVLFATFFQLGTASSAMRFFPYFKSKDKHHNGFFFYLISLVSLGFILFIPVFFVLKDSITTFFAEGSPEFNHYLLWVIPLTFFLLYWITFELYSNILMRIAIPKFIREIVVRILLIGVYMLYGLGYLDLDGFVTCFVCVYGIAMLITFIYISRIGSVSLKHNPDFISPSLKKDFLSYTSFIMLGSIGASMVNRIDVFMIGAGMNLAWTGIYSMAFNMSNIIEIPSRSISTISAPLAADALKRGDISTASVLYKKVSLHQLLLGSSLFILIWINIDNIYSIIPNGGTFSSGKWVVFFIGVAKLIEMTIGFGGSLIGFSKYYKWNLFFTLFLTFITILFNWLLIPRLGISGAAIATLSTYIIGFGVQLLIVYSKIGLHPYSMGTLKILGVIGLSFIMDYILPTLSNPWIDGLYRTIIIALIAGTLIYVLKISNEANNIIGSIWKKLIK